MPIVVSRKSEKTDWESRAQNRKGDDVKWALGKRIAQAGEGF